MISVWEEGGGATNSGSATVVCDVHGEAMAPSYVPTSGHLSNGQHARFDVEECVTVTASHGGGHENLLVEHHLGDRVRVLARCHDGEWEWPADAPDPTADSYMYSTAIVAAICKSCCYHCRHVHFARTRTSLYR